MSQILWVITARGGLAAASVEACYRALACWTATSVLFGCTGCPATDCFIEV